MDAKVLFWGRADDYVDEACVEGSVGFVRFRIEDKWDFVQKSRLPD